MADEPSDLRCTAVFTTQKLNKANVKNLKLAYAVAIGGTSANENLQSTPLVEDGFMYIVDQWVVLYKIDVRSGDMGRIVWRMDTGQERFLYRIAAQPCRETRHHRR